MRNSIHGDWRKKDFVVINQSRRSYWVKLAKNDTQVFYCETFMTVDSTPDSGKAKLIGSISAPWSSLTDRRHGE
jgi:hypothetical protein